MKKKRTLILAESPRSFCAGVVLGPYIVEKALDEFMVAPIYSKHEIVHNSFVDSKDLAN